MIRFLPDDWRETLLRPIAMAAPDAGVYIEVMAPDLRFVFILALLVLLGAFAPLRRGWGQPQRRPAFVLLAALAALFVPWMATSANGRYFITGLLVAGPVCIALVWLLPITRAARLAAAILLVALQGFAVQQASPWGTWGLAQWTEPPYFQVELPPDLRQQPATYVTMANISYSLIAPQFPAQSRWMSIANTPVERGVDEFLARAQADRLFLIVPVVPSSMAADGLPNEDVARIMNDRLKAYGLSFGGPAACRFLRSEGIARMALRRESQADPALARRLGFWACHLAYSKPTPVPDAADAVASRHDAVFSRVESSCPRFFPPGQHNSLVLPDGEVRTYLDGEMKLYVFDAGDVMYKYYRAFNPVKIGSVADVAAGKAVIDCAHIRGRSGLPWERAI
ncbi:hypothetical protein LZ009_18375 [Ramlibacter sp. XY19]|uniref:hypothetical protein n=1 Tax=Ramlibacter paludis TaxID=2908000 RepID=UPI0023DB1579|nr:hypothetical protein [Ramlibacter paludis]MCG2594750.1 hypothetical protein [Ramlibacter paludis]